MSTANACPAPWQYGRAGAVVDARGRVHGLEGLLVADASIMPHMTSAPTNLSTIVIAERIARWHK
jgi:choline dehydrogenase